MLTNQEALDFVQEMLNAREPNVMNHLAANGAMKKKRKKKLKKNK